MNCHGNKKEKQGTHNHSSLKHTLHMAICCGLPIIIIGLLPIITKLNPSAGSVIGRVTPFLCPIMMIFMIPMMMGINKKGSCCNTKETNSNSKEIV
ncbi:hypothetical protein [Clostridium coskatii]|uniref:DUF2933 domain-containing protein n=1 Tax=Clostridium coskatii TaxID=1705578 RepID=A0A162LIR0_9CLOT|nr:hypothetical protein [Clostridium coskatii]OAA94016.1 hypothetical protein WX73_03586 [Clostridium coskatii]OBR90165.1 hypothetical protein CLCOS_41420 [Clostridium coskatii]